MEVVRTGNRIKLTQTKYIEQMAERFGLTDANYVVTPMDANSHLTVDDQAASFGKHRVHSSHTETASTHAEIWLYTAASFPDGTSAVGGAPPMSGSCFM